MTNAEIEKRIEGIHRAGAERHPDVWLQVNMRAVAETWGSKLDITEPANKLMLATIILRVLDYAVPQEPK